MYIHLVKNTDPTSKDFHWFASRKLESYKQTDQDKKQNNEEYDLCKMKDMLKDNYGKQCNGLMDRTCDNMMSVESNSPDSMSYDRINNSRDTGLIILELGAYPVTEWLRNWTTSFKFLR